MGETGAKPAGGATPGTSSGVAPGTKPLRAWEVYRLCVGDAAGRRSVQHLAVELRPSRRILGAVVERLKLTGYEAEADMLSQLRDLWHARAYGRAPLQDKTLAEVVVQERRGSGPSYLYVEVPVDPFKGAMPGDTLQIRGGDCVVMVSHHDGQMDEDNPKTKWLRAQRRAREEWAPVNAAVADANKPR